MGVTSWKRQCSRWRSVCVGVRRVGNLEVTKLCSPLYRLGSPGLFRIRCATFTTVVHLCILYNVWSEAVAVWQAFIDCVWNVMAHAQKPDFVFRRNGRVYLSRRGSQFSRLLAAELCASAVVMVVILDTPCSEVVRRVLATHSIRQFPLHFPTRASPCAITFQLGSTCHV